MAADSALAATSSGTGACLGLSTLTHPPNIAMSRPNAKTLLRGTTSRSGLWSLRIFPTYSSNCLAYIFDSLRLQFDIRHDHNDTRPRVMEDLHAFVGYLQFAQCGLYVLRCKPVIGEKRVRMHHVAAPLRTNASRIRVAMPEYSTGNADAVVVRH